MSPLKEIRLWSDTKKIDRIRSVFHILNSLDIPKEQLEGIYPKDAIIYLDEIIILGLEVLRSVSKELNIPLSPLELFEEVLLKRYTDENVVRIWIRNRFIETEALIDIYKSSDIESRKNLANTLSDRGVI